MEQRTVDQQEQMDFFYEIFDASLPRLGPGDDASTLRALKELLSIKPQQKDDSGPSGLRVLDIGCGNGPQTLQLAKHMNGNILAVDNHQPYLDELNRRAKVAGLSEKIQTRLMDMSDLSQRDGIFDLIWSEGALNLMGFADGVLNPTGFRDGLKACHGLLASSGLLAVSELCWFRPDPPSECRRFFSTAYPAMATADVNLSLMKSCGFEIIGNFHLPESAWWEQYYRPLEDLLRSFRERYAADQEKLDFIKSIQEEIDIYRKHSSYYGYIFYLMRSC
jgi:SAM-dependent methyltransferase